MQKPIVDLVGIAGNDTEVAALTDRLQREPTGEALRLWPEAMLAQGPGSPSPVFAKLEVDPEE